MKSHFYTLYRSIFNIINNIGESSLPICYISKTKFIGSIDVYFSNFSKLLKMKLPLSFNNQKAFR